MAGRVNAPVTILLALAAAAAAGCRAESNSTSGTFDKTLTVEGAARLELQNGSGRTRITSGPSGSVRIHGEFHSRQWPWGNRERASDLASNPPIAQDHNLIRIGFDLPRDTEVNYSIEAPADTEVRATSGSGELGVKSIHGPVALRTGSGGITAEQIAGDVQATTGSGTIRLVDIKGQAEISSGSGDLVVSKIGGETRMRTGSGEIMIDQPGSAATNAKTGSGNIHIAGASADINIRTASGEVRVDGNPASGAYWEVHTSSGDVTLRVPDKASFRLHAHASSNSIRSTIPLVIEEQSRNDLRAHVGQGNARIEVQTGSGEVHIE